MGQKLEKEKDNMNVPGPGNYDPDNSVVLKKLPQYSMKQRLGSTLGAGGVNSPAPGAYEVHLKNKTDAPKYGFGSSTRAGYKGNAVPGPGAYKINVRVADTPAYAIPNKKEDVKYV